MVIVRGDLIVVDSLRDLLDYWNSKRVSNALPPRAAIDPVEIPRLLKHVFLADVLDGGGHFRFRVAGHLVCHLWGQEITRRYLDEICAPTVYQEVRRQYLEPVETRQPCYHRNAYCGPTGRVTRFERLLLPLSDDGRTVGMLLGGAARLPPGGYVDGDGEPQLTPNTLVDLLAVREPPPD